MIWIDQHEIGCLETHYQFLFLVQDLDQSDDDTTIRFTTGAFAIKDRRAGRAVGFRDTPVSASVIHRFPEN